MSKTLVIVSACFLFISGLLRAQCWYDLEPIWTDRPDSFSTSGVFVQDNLCILMGRIHGHLWSLTGRVPAQVRPCRNHMFCQNNHRETCRIDLFKDGRIFWKAGGKKHGWISLAGMAYSRRMGDFLILEEGVSIYKSTFAPATVVKEGSVCLLDGVVQTSRMGLLTRLSKGRRPIERLVFSVSNDGIPARVDITDDGRVLWVDGFRKRTWLSLSGLIFSTKYGTPLVLENGWRDYGHDYGGARIARDGDIRVISGLVVRGETNLISILPPGDRPPQRLAFNAGDGQQIARIDILPDGRILWVAGRRDCRIVSLSGIIYPTVK